MARHTFPLDGEYVIKVKLLEINLGSIRGLEYEHQLEVTVDGERVLLAPVGGPEDYTRVVANATNVVNSLAERLQVRVKVQGRAAPRRRGVSAEAGGAGRQPAAALPCAARSSRPITSACLTSRTSRSRGPFNADRRQRHAEPSSSLHVYAHDPSRASGSPRAKSRGEAA